MGLKEEILCEGKIPAILCDCSPLHNYIPLVSFSLRMLSTKTRTSLVLSVKSGP